MRGLKRNGKPMKTFINVMRKVHYETLNRIAEDTVYENIQAIRN